VKILNTRYGRPPLDDRAVAFSKKYDVPVFICRADKSPVTPNGFKNASRCEATIRSMCKLPGAALVAFPTGQASGLMSFDFDGRAGLNWMADNLKVRTRTQNTRRGVHALFKYQPGIRCSANKIAKGVDIRSDGGYLIAWEAQGYGGRDCEPAELPEWLLAAIVAATARGPLVSTTAIAERNPQGAGLDTLANLRTRCNLTLDQGRGLAEYADVDSYDSWVQLGQALQHEYDDAGFDIWIEASRRSDKFPGVEECAKKWASFGRQSGLPVTMRAVIAAAKRLGATPAMWSSAPAKPLSANTVFEFIPARELVKRPPPRWWIKGVLPDADLGLVYAGSGDGKTFWITDLCMYMASGLNWRGHRTKRARIAVICAEGGGAYHLRLKAAAKHLGVNLSDPDVVFDVLVAAPQLTDRDTLAALVAAVKGRYDVVIVDTLAQVSSSLDENSSEMQQALTACRELRAATGAMVILVHHAGKDASKGARGWSGMRAAVDFEIEVTRNADNTREARVSKQKDGSDGARFGFRLVSTALDGVIDEDGEQVWSCYVEPVELEALPTKVQGPKHRLGKHEQIVEQAAVAVCGVKGTASEADVITEAVRHMASPEDGKRDLRRDNARRALESVSAKGGFVSLLDGVVTTTAFPARHSNAV
jgi:AAA domain/Primase C terminal 2 (PriCT-2)/Bifunctional DNA primase/polymerase, N-terminal